jgi:D-methionine transport system substrate-binding protein
MKNRFLRSAAGLLAGALLAGSLAGCSSSSNQQTATDAATTAAVEANQNAEETTAAQKFDNVTVRIGLTGTIYEDIWNPIAEKLKDEGINIELVQFSSFAIPNEALNAGDIEMNAFQHHAYFNSDTSKNGYDLTPIGDTFIIAMNLYSNKIKDVSELKDGDKIAIPDDASNGGRALKLLESAGIINIKADAGSNPEVSDIESYNTQVEIVEVEAANVCSILPDVTAAVINGNYALDYGIDPETAIFHETEYADDSYFCLIAVRTADKDNPVYQRIVEEFQSEDTKKIFQDTFKGFFVPAWEQ